MIFTIYIKKYRRFPTFYSKILKIFFLQSHVIFCNVALKKCDIQGSGSPCTGQASQTMNNSLSRKQWTSASDSRFRAHIFISKPINMYCFDPLKCALSLFFILYHPHYSSNFSYSLHFSISNHSNALTPFNVPCLFFILVYHPH